MSVIWMSKYDEWNSALSFLKYVIDDSLKIKSDIEQYTRLYKEYKKTY